jgi:ribosomal protein S18 acetylase RimI-like enzyme
LADLREEGLAIHAIGIPACEPALLEEFSLLSWGRIVLDAARPAHELLASLPVSQEGDTDSDAPSLVVRRARPADAEALARLDQSLADHIAAPPVLMPDTRPSNTTEWREWLGEPENITVIAECDGRAVGFMKAAPPQMDVSWFVHSPHTLAICGLWVDPSCRGRHLGERLLRFLVTSALARQKDGAEPGAANDEELLVSVDCETHNPEARAFWLSHFEPVSWSFERRF